MTNYRRWRVSGGTYFFTVVTLGRRPFLTDDLARRSLREAFRIMRTRRPFQVDAIVLLPDHLHAIWTLPPGDFDYATRWQLIKRRFTKSFLAAGSSEGRRSASRLTKGERGLWQRRYFEHTCRDETDLKRCADYRDERFSLLLVDAGELGIERHVDEEAAIFFVEPHSGGDFDVGHLSGTFAMLAATTAAAGPATGEFSNFEIRH